MNTHGATGSIPHGAVPSPLAAGGIAGPSGLNAGGSESAHGGIPGSCNTHAFAAHLSSTSYIHIKPAARRALFVVHAAHTMLPIPLDNLPPAEPVHMIERYSNSPPAFFDFMFKWIYGISTQHIVPGTWCYVVTPTLKWYRKYRSVMSHY